MRRLFLTLALVAACAAPALVFGAGSARAENFTREQIEQIVREFIEKNPKVLMDSVENYGKQQQAEENKRSAEEIAKNADWLFKNPKHAEAGNPNGDITIVEFFDYNCGYCKQALSDVMTLLDQDKNLRLVFVEIPILGDSSLLAARWALASLPQKRYLEYHISLMRHKGPLDEPTLEDYAKKAGINVDRLKKDITDPKINDMLNENLMMSQTLGIQGTPAFIVGDQLVRGYVGLSGLKDAVADARLSASLKKAQKP